MSNIDFKQKGLWVTIINKSTNDIMASGLLVAWKDMHKQLISFDFRYFFSTEENSLYRIETSSISQNSIPFDYDKYKENVFPYANQNDIEFATHCIFREYDMTELDPEIAPLVYALNKAGYETTGSCCGHGKKEGWIRVNFKDFPSLLFLFDILNKERFRYKFLLRMNAGDINIKPGEIRLSLDTMNIGEEAYRDILDLAKYIDKKIDMKC